jgi:hypothetical protein
MIEFFLLLWPIGYRHSLNSDKMVCGSLMYVKIEFAGYILDPFVMPNVRIILIGVD